ncbi:MAG: alpha/beta hydrolase [Bacteroidota bacterium]
MTDPFVSVEGHRLAVVTGGDASDPRPPVLLMPGVVMPAAFWPPNLPTALRDGRRWAALSLPAHAPSAVPADWRPEAVTLDLFARLADGAARDLWGEMPFVVGGYSTGGFAALCTAAARPERVAGVLAVSAFIDGRWGGLLGVLQRLARGGPLGGALFRAATLANQRLSSVFCAVLGAHAARDVDPERYNATLDAIGPDVRRHDADAMRAFFAGVRALDLTPHLGRITAPTLAVHGARDIVPLVEAETVAAEVDGARLVVLPETGHLFFAEAWDAFDAAASGWLDALSVPEAAA